VTGTQWEHQPEVREALRTIVSDPQFGASALSTPQALSNLLKDLLPDSPRETSVLVAAAEAGLPQLLADHIAQGMDLATASRLAESAFAARTPFTAAACSWVVAELAAALRPAPASSGQRMPAQPGPTWPAPSQPAGPGQQWAAAPAAGPGLAASAETQLPAGGRPAGPGWYAPPPVGARPAARRPPGPPPAGVVRARRIPPWVYLLGAGVALLIIAVIAAAAAHRGTGQAVEPLSQLIKPDVKQCRAASALAMPGVTASLACTTADLRIGVSAYQFGGATAYRAGLAHLNHLTGWDPSVAGQKCPPPVGRSIGHEGWHTLHDPKFGTPRPGQFLECYTDTQASGLFLYLWTLPSQRVILVAGDSVPGASYTDLQKWWEKLTYG
jgi:hypothetical protein